MQRAAVVLCVAAVFSLLLSTTDDVLYLSNGGRLAGTVIELEFTSDGAKKKYAGTEVESLVVSVKARDTLTLRKGTRLEGEVASVKFKSVGGELSFERTDVVGLSLEEDPIAKTRKELDAKKAALPANDAKALYELAAWCAEKKLQAEAAQLARRSLVLDANTEFAAKAHELAGDVLYQGKWMTAAELRKLKEQEAGAEGPKEAPKDPKPPKEPEKIVDGVFTASGKGFKGPVTVAVKVVDGKIAAVKVTKHQENRAKNALTEIPSRIVEKQRTDVDVVTGASITSRAIMKGAEEALASRTRKPADGIADGAYTGAARGYVADVKVAVRVKGGRFESVRVVQNKENRARTALTDVPQRMVEQQRTDVDAVTHATITSKAIIKAVEGALDEARKKAQ